MSSNLERLHLTNQTSYIDLRFAALVALSCAKVMNINFDERKESFLKEVRSERGFVLTLRVFACLDAQVVQRLVRHSILKRDYCLFRKF